MSAPRVLIVGGPDVDARLPLMRRLQADFEVAALGSDPAIAARFAEAGFAYHPYRLARTTNPLLDLLSLAQLVRIFRAQRPAIVHAFDTKPGVWACLAARIAGVPVVIGTITGLGSLYANDGVGVRVVRAVYQNLQKLACAASDLTIFQNRDDCEQLVRAGVVRRESALVIPGSGVVTDVYDRARIGQSERSGLRAELGLGPDEVIVTMISRVIRSKGVPEYLVAAKAVRERVPEARFLLVGPNDSDSVDRLTATELDELGRSVTWTGPRRDIPTVLAISHLVVLPSAYREGIPRVLLEGASMGLPLVTTDAPGCNDVVEHGVNGFLVPPKDAAALTAAINTLVAQPELREQFGRVSRRRAVERFDLTVIAARTRDEYGRLLESRGNLALATQ